MYLDTEEDTFPLLSICFEDFLSEENLRQQNPYTNVSQYLNFLKGNVFESKLLEVEYIKSTKNISKYLISYSVLTRNGEQKNASATEDLLKLSFIGSWWGDFLTCYSFNVQQNAQIPVQQIHLNSSIFPNSRRNTEKGLYSVLHYRNQILLPGIL